MATSITVQCYPDYDEGVVKWEGQMTLRLRWVAGARPFNYFGTECCEVLLAGSGYWMTINMTYEQFMEFWEPTVP